MCSSAFSGNAFLGRRGICFCSTTCGHWDDPCSHRDLFESDDQSEAVFLIYQPIRRSDYAPPALGEIFKLLHSTEDWVTNLRLQHFVIIIDDLIDDRSGSFQSSDTVFCPL